MECAPDKLYSEHVTSLAFLGNGSKEHIFIYNQGGTAWLGDGKVI